jgi:hypothetical protein
LPQRYNNPDCRTDAKPIKWEYLLNADRKRLYEVNAALAKLRQHPSFGNLFTSNQMDYNLTPAFKRFRVSSGGLHMVVVGNFDVVQQSSTVTFPVAGTWYDYLNGGTFSATGGGQNITLQPGEYHVPESTGTHSRYHHQFFR